MTTLLSDEYTFAGESWLDYEDNQLIKEYKTEEKSLMEISKIHKRMPGGIVTRLKTLGLITVRSHTRGYIEYQRSDLYKEIVRNNAGKKGKKQEVKQNNDKELTRKSNLILETITTSHISTIRNEISVLNKKVDKVLVMMNALYEFESS